MKNTLTLAIIAAALLITTTPTHALFNCVDAKNEIIRENRKLAALINRKERLEYRYEAKLWFYKTKMEAASLAVEVAVDNLRSMEEQVVRMGYGCVLEPIPCNIAGSRRLVSALTRSRSEIAKARRVFDTATEKYYSFDAQQYPHTRALDDKIESSRAYIQELQFTVEICSRQ